MLLGINVLKTTTKTEYRRRTCCLSSVLITIILRALYVLRMRSAKSTTTSLLPASSRTGLTKLNAERGFFRRRFTISERTITSGLFYRPNASQKEKQCYPGRTHYVRRTLQM